MSKAFFVMCLVFAILTAYIGGSPWVVLINAFAAGGNLVFWMEGI